MANWFRPKKILVPINPTTIFCEKTFCTVIFIPLRVCKEITVHKA